MEYKDIVLLKKIIISNLNPFCKKSYFNKNLSLKETQYIMNFYGNSLGEKIYHFLNDTSEPPKCICGKNLKFICVKEGYRKYCSRHCRAISLKRTPEQIEKMKTSYKNTMIEKYGVENSFQLEDVKKKIYEKRDEQWYTKRRQNSMKTNNIKYGCDWPMQNLEIKTKSINTQIKNYGAIFGGKIPENRSKGEKEIFDTIRSWGFKAIHNTRSIIKPYELDIYIPEKKLGIEYNGDYWHCMKRIHHKIKFNKCIENGIKLIQIWESEYKKYKEDILNNIFNILCDKPLNKNFFIFYEKDGHHYQSADWPPQKKYICLTEENKRWFNNDFCYDCGSYLLD